MDTSLNPGTGSTDLVVGAYYYQPVSQNVDAFVNGQAQVAARHALNQPGQDFRPGNYQTLSLGLRYEARAALGAAVTAQRHPQEPRQTGALADNADTTGTVVYVSPGATVLLAGNLHAFGFVQQPVFSRLDGYQVFPRVTASLGLSYAF